MGDSERTLAVDLGGTHMRVAVVEAAGQILERREAPTPKADARPVALVELVRSVLAGPSGLGASRAVMGIPGPVDYQLGRLDWAPHLPVSWLPELTEEALSEATGVPVALANDADLAAVGEAWFGAGRGFADVVYVTISTGIGAGVVLGGRLVHGRRSLAEVGHSVMDADAWGQGRPATFEHLASGTALARLGAEAGIAGGGAEVERLARSGDARALAVWERVVAAAAVGLGNLAELFSPEVIVVGGGVGLSGDGFLAPVRRCLAQRPPPGFARPGESGMRFPEVVRASLGDDAGLAGAAAWSSAFVPALGAS